MDEPEWYLQVDHGFRRCEIWPSMDLLVHVVWQLGERCPCEPEETLRSAEELGIVEIQGVNAPGYLVVSHRAWDGRE